MSITRDEVAHLARLARIELSDAELDHLAPSPTQAMSGPGSPTGRCACSPSGSPRCAATSHRSPPRFPPTTHATGLTNVFRDDVPVPCLTPEQALDQAPAVEQQRFKVPRILGEE